MTWLGKLQRLAVGTFFVFASACGGSEAPDGRDWHAVYDTIGDTIVVRTERGSIWGGEATLVPVLTIGVVDGADEYMLGSVLSLAVAPGGSIYAFDGHAKALRKYTRDGVYVTTFGREGGGPGEYKTPDAGLVVLSDGRVVLRDPGNARLNVYSPDGEPLDSWRVMGSIRSSIPMFRDTADNVYTRALLDPGAAISDWTFGLARYGPDGSVRDTLPEPTYDYVEPQLEARGTDEDNPSYASRPVPFTPQVEWSFSPMGYMVAGLPTRYAVDLFVAPNRVLRVERADWQPVPVNSEERAEYERLITDMLRRWADPAWNWNGPAIPDTKPPYRGLFVGLDGRIWVQLYQPAYQKVPPAGQEPDPTEQTWVEPIAFDVFEPDGRYLGMVRVPDGFSTYPQPVARGETLWAVVRDELDVPQIVQFQLKHGG